MCYLQITSKQTETLVIKTELTGDLLHHRDHQITLYVDWNPTIAPKLFLAWSWSCWRLLSLWIFFHPTKIVPKYSMHYTVYLSISNTSLFSKILLYAKSLKNSKSAFVYSLWDSWEFSCGPWPFSSQPFTIKNLYFCLDCRFKGWRLV